jgi:hypothetical protein
LKYLDLARILYHSFKPAWSGQRCLDGRPDWERWLTQDPEGLSGLAAYVDKAKNGPQDPKFFNQLAMTKIFIAPASS